MKTSVTCFVLHLRWGAGIFIKLCSCVSTTFQGNKLYIRYTKWGFLLGGLFLLALSCDNREILLPVELPYEGDKLFIYALLEDEKIPKVLVSHTLPIDGTPSPVGAVVSHASVQLFENGVLMEALFFRSDTSIRYDIISVFNPDGSIEYDTTAVHKTVSAYYTTATPLKLIDGFVYHLEVEAAGYPSAFSDPVCKKNEISIQHIQFSEPIRDDLAGNVTFPDVSFQLQKNGSAAENSCVFEYKSWYNNSAYLNHSANHSAASFALDIPPAPQADIPVLHRNVQLWDIYISDDENCIQGCYIPAEGALLTVITYDAATTAFKKAQLDNSENLGGFFPPNPYFPHTIEGGYGLFSIVEIDTLILK